jgi:glycosyltransferase involved in cell wall biosynthesis
MIYNLHIYPVVFKHETRILKEISAIEELTHSKKKIRVLSFSKNNNDSIYNLSENIVIEGVSVNNNYFVKYISSKFKTLIFIYRSYFKFKKQNIEFINCHSLSSLVIGVLLKKGSAKTLIYDPHELETEKQNFSKVARFLSKHIEKYLIKYVDQIITVCDPISEWYRHTYDLKIPVCTIRNIPELNKYDTNKMIDLKHNYSIKNDDVLFIYQGILSSHRGIDILLKVFSKVNRDKHIIFMGYGNFETEIKKYSKKFNNIHFKEAVAPSEIISYTSSCDIGIHFNHSKVSLSYSFSLPNKFFEYLSAGIPLLVSNSYEHMTSLIYKYRLGYSISSDVDKLINSINKLNYSEIKTFKKNINMYTNKNSWKKEKELYKSIYN